MRMNFKFHCLPIKTYFSSLEEDEKAVEKEEIKKEKAKKTIEKLVKEKKLRIITKNVWYLLHNSSKKKNYKQLTSFTNDNKPIGDAEASIENLEYIIDKIMRFNEFEIQVI